MLTWLDPGDHQTPFPPVERALSDPDGLLAVGGDLSPRRLLRAYADGIFPWYSEGQPILWWSPDPRMVLFPDRVRVRRSLRKVLRKQVFEVALDQAFPEVMEGCAEPRQGQNGTWITEDMLAAYCRLHELGWAHSVEVRRDGELVGGLYGVALGRLFFGESMFSRATDASKVALVYLARHLHHYGFLVIDCQTRTEHLISMGAQEIPRIRFRELVRRGRDLREPADMWQMRPELLLDDHGPEATGVTP